MKADSQTTPILNKSKTELRSIPQEPTQKNSYIGSKKSSYEINHVSQLGNYTESSKLTVKNVSKYTGL